MFVSLFQEIVDCMYPMEYAKGSLIIKEGDIGSIMYVMEEGKVEVSRENKFLSVMSAGKLFGELAILYNCKRTASVRAVCDSRVWALERKVFQHIMVASGIKKIENQKNFLKSVPLLAELPQEMLTKMADVLETEQFLAGDYIIRQDTAGDTFYILAGGEVRVTKREGDGEEETIRELLTGDYFGEQALLKTDLRTANVIALSNVECLTLDRE